MLGVDARVIVSFIFFIFYGFLLFTVEEHQHPSTIPSPALSGCF